MVILEELGIVEIFHYTPLHYLPLIARASSLKAKPILLEEGFLRSHFRSMSRHRDEERGFGAFLHLTTHNFPPILAAKLASGFPHVRLAVPSSTLESRVFDLCRFNVAMTRRLRRNGKAGFPESDTNGRYYDQMQIPIARTHEDQAALLARHALRGDMVEVLVRGSLPLPADLRVDVFSEADLCVARKVVGSLGRGWRIQQVALDSPYPRSTRYASAVHSFIHSALADPSWRGDGLEFDRVSQE